MDPALGFEVAVAERRVHLHSGVLDSCLFTRLEVEDLGWKSLPLQIAGVHAEEHLSPILRLGPTGARVDGHDRAVGVTLLRKEALQLERLDFGEKLLRLALKLVGEGFVRLLLDERDQALGVLDLTLQLTVGLIDPTQRFELGNHLLGGLGVVPKVGLRHLGLELPGAPLALFDVKDSP